MSTNALREAARDQLKLLSERIESSTDSIVLSEYIRQLENANEAHRLSIQALDAALLRERKAA